MATKSFRGEDNYFRDAVENTVVVLKKFSRENNREIRNYYTEDVLNPICPCFVVLVNGSKDEMRAANSNVKIRYTIHINVEVRYYEEDLTEETKRNEITYVLWEISELLKRNFTLNGFVPKLGMEILSTRWGVQQKGNRMLAGGAINLLAKKLYNSIIER